MLTFIDSLLNRITMYRLVLYTLIVYLGAAAVFGAVGILPYKPLNIAFSGLFLVIVAWVVNGIFAAAFKAQPNSESAYITALILALIITPVAPTDGTGIMFLVWAGAWAMASKYIVAARKKHLFNPAAFAVALTAITVNQSASWWVGGNLPLLGFVLAGGFLIVRKIQRFDLVLPFLIAAIAAIVTTSGTGISPDTAWKTILHTSLLFFASIMLTEPMTTPPTRGLRIAYGALAGLLFAPAIHLGPLHSTPELALLAANIFSYTVSPKAKYSVTLAEKKKVGASIYDFAFASDSRPKYRPGQYMEWTLGHEKTDGRGNRRYFTLASSPTEPQLRLGVRFYENPSSFKRKLLSLEPGATMIAGQLAGDFTLPDNPAQRLVFIAGGIGITPFRSMVKYLTDRREKRDIVLFYSSRTPADVAYRDVLDEATEKIGLRAFYIMTEQGQRIDAPLIMQAAPDYRERMFYISGTHAMVTDFTSTLRRMGIPRSRIKTDFFPGFA